MPKSLNIAVTCGVVAAVALTPLAAAVPATSRVVQVEQAATGTLTGRVLNKEGAPAANIQIRLTGQNQAFDGGDLGMQDSRVVTTDAEGRYSAPNLAAKLWRYQINRPGHPDGSARGIVTITAGETVEREITLR